MTAVRAARSLGATMSRSGFWRIKVSTCATCLLLSCCPSLITSLTSGCPASSLVRKAFCAARYGSALFAWLNATTNCFLPALPPPQPPRSSAPARLSKMTNRRVIKSVSAPLMLHRYRQDDDHRLDDHLHITVHIVQA